MAALSSNVAYAKQVFQDRLGQDYNYGGSWSPTDLSAGTDCSGLVGMILEAVVNGPNMIWGHPVSTESWPYDYNTGTPAPPGTVGPYGTIAVGSFYDIPADAAMIVNIHHGGGGEYSHMNCVCGGWVMEDNGDAGVCTTVPPAMASTDSYWTDHWYLPGPIEGAAPPMPSPPAPVYTLFADVSEFQVPVDDSYPHPVLSIRVCDGTYQDHNFSQNYRWMRQALDSGKLVCGIVYTYCESNWQDNLNTFTGLIDSNGGLHPRVAIMMDLEWDNNNSGDLSGWLNPLHDALVRYAGDPRRVIAYAASSHVRGGIWSQVPPDMKWVIASYGDNPDWPGKIAHQYSNGTGYGAQSGLPDGASPFGNCDMNSADGLYPDQFAAACGIFTTPPMPSLADLVWSQFVGV